MTTPDEEITMRQADVEALHARMAEVQQINAKLEKRNKALVYLWHEAKELAEQWRNEAVNGDKCQSGFAEEPLPWEPDENDGPDDIARRELSEYYARGDREFHQMHEDGEL